MEFTLKRNTKKSIAIITAMAIILTLLMPMGGAFASATDSHAETVPRVTDGDNRVLGTLVIEEDNRSFAVGDLITVTLPAGVEYEDEAPLGLVNGPITVLQATYYVGERHTGLIWEIVSATKKSVTIEAKDLVGGGGVAGKCDGDIGENDKLKFKFNVTNHSRVDIDDDVTGDIRVTIESDQVTAEDVRVARVVIGETTTTIDDVEAAGLDDDVAIGTIKIRENAADIFSAAADDNEIELTLPDGFKWGAYFAKEKDEDPSIKVVGEKLTGTGILAAEIKTVDDEVLTIEITTADANRANFLTVAGLVVDVPEDANLGDVEMNVDGDNITEQDIVIAEVGDFGFEVETKGDIPTIVAGKAGKEIADIIIDETAPGSWDNDRSVIMEMPGWAEWYEGEPHGADGPLGDGVRDEDDKEEARWNVADEDKSKAELKDMKVSIDADAPAGDLTVEIRGRAGVTGELVVAEIVRPFEVTAEKHEMAIGVRGQTVGDITITETQAEAICENKWVIIKAPRGFEFEDFDVEVTDGDMKIEDEETEGRYLAFRIDQDSNREASTIKITGMEFDVDRHIPEGDVNFEIFMTKGGESDYEADGTEPEAGETVVDYTVLVGDNFDRVTNDDNYEDVTSVVVATVTTPAPLAVSSTVFTIGSAIFNVDGVMRAMDVAPYVKDGRTFLPVRFVAQSVGVADDNIDWNAETRTVTLTEGDTVVELVIGSKTITIDGASEVMDVAPELTAGRTMLPARAVAEAFGFSVGWDAATRAVVISN